MMKIRTVITGMFILISCSACKKEKERTDYNPELTFYRFIPTNELEISHEDFDYYFRVVDSHDKSGVFTGIRHLVVDEGDGSGEFPILSEENDGSQLLENEWITASLTEDKIRLRIQIKQNDTPFIRRVLIQPVHAPLFHSFDYLKINQLPLQP